MARHRKNMTKEDANKIVQFINMEGIYRLEALGFNLVKIQDRNDYKNSDYVFSMNIGNKSNNINASAYIRVWPGGWVNDEYYIISGTVDNCKSSSGGVKGFFWKEAYNLEQFETNFEKLIDYLEE